MIVTPGENPGILTSHHYRPAATLFETDKPGPGGTR